MRKILRWVGVALVGLLGVLLIASVALYSSTKIRLNKTYTISSEMVAVPTDSASLERGQHLFTIHCAVCHGMNLAGSVIFDDPNLGSITAPNIAAGRGKDGSLLSDERLILAIRHGVGSNDKPLLIMPSESFSYLTDQDLGEVIGYVKSVPPVENPLPATSIKPLGMVLISAGAFGKVIAVEEIDHNAPRPALIEPGVTMEYGDYLVRTGECSKCHGAELAGGKDPNPDAPPVPNLTRGGDLGNWTEQDFMQTLRTGRTPEGRQLSGFMPWVFMGQMTDDELKAVWLYLQSLPALPSKQ
jgi:mono/diheme cytochrome c family protein